VPGLRALRFYDTSRNTSRVTGPSDRRDAGSDASVPAVATTSVRFSAALRATDASREYHGAIRRVRRGPQEAGAEP
jgi:hypothetical protein